MTSAPELTHPALDVFNLGRIAIKAKLRDRAKLAELAGGTLSKAALEHPIAPRPAPRRASVEELLAMPAPLHKNSRRAAVA